MNSSNYTAAVTAGASLTKKSELAQLIYCCLLVVLGIPLNLIALIKLLRPRKTTYNRNRKHSRRGSASVNHHQQVETMFLLKLNLNLTDLLILSVYAPGKIGWLFVEQWLGGNGLCKIFQFVSALSFFASSFAIVCIATVRLIAVRFGTPDSWRKVRARLIVPFSWAVAVALAAPQLYVWRTFSPFEHLTQCTTVFAVRKFEGNEVYAHLEALYSWFSVFAMFWLPALYITLAYSYIFVKLRHLSKGAGVSASGDKCDVFRTFKKRSSNLLETESPVSKSPRTEIQWRKQLRSVRRKFDQTGLLAAVYLLCWLPYFVSGFFPSQLRVLNTLIVLHSALNPIVYAFD